MSDRKEELRKAMSVDPNPGGGIRGKKPSKRKKWYDNKRNWGFWVLVGGFLIYLLSNFVIRPWVS